MLECSASGVSNIKDIASYTVNQFTTSYVQDCSILRWALIGYPCTDLLQSTVYLRTTLSHMFHPITSSTPCHHMLHPITCSTPSHAPPYHMVHSITCPTPSHGPDNYIYNIMLGELDQEFRNMYLRLHNAELELLIGHSMCQSQVFHNQQDLNCISHVRMECGLQLLLS